MMKKSLHIVALLLVLALAFAGCSAGVSHEDAQPLEGNGFSASFHPAVWTRLSNDETQVTYSHTEADAFVALVRLDGETARGQDITQPEGMEALLHTYAANYSAANEEIAAKDMDAEYVRTLSFTYDDAEISKPYTYLAKLMVNKDSGEALTVLAAYPNDCGKSVKEEIKLVMDSAAMTERTEDKA